MRLIVPCPAKVNLFLAVGPRDARGWHPLRTVFQAVDLCDELEVEPAPRNEVLSDADWLPEENTLTRTLRLLGEVISLPPLRVFVRKRIPAESGLGGGSSNAAGLIRAAQAIAGGQVPAKEVDPIALTVGADVPFFLVGGRAQAEGYGEKLTPLPDAPERYFVIARPDVGCATPEMFRRLDERPYPWREFPEEDELYNDFERVAPCECLDLIERLRSLDADDAGLSGSGSAVFGRFPDHTEATTAASLLQGEFKGQTWIVRSLTRRESLQMIPVDG